MPADQSCVRRADGAILCRGWNGEGGLGDGTTTDASSPRLVPGLSGVAQIAVGDSHTCARRMDGTVMCWGRNEYGQLGDGTTVANRLSPRSVLGLSGVAAIGLGHVHTCARKTDGAIVCWGYNHTGQLGDGTLVTRTSPTSVTGLTGAAELAVGLLVHLRA